jgi:tetratricopeptide (TPR) repeat protein
VEASLQLSYAALPAEAQQTFVQLGVFVADLTREAATAVIVLHGKYGTSPNGISGWFRSLFRSKSATPTATAQSLDETLSLLCRRSLLDYDAASERYDLHDLARAFALARLPDERPARLRHARYYTQVAYNADLAFVQGRQLQGLALFDQERRQIDAGWKWTMEQSPDEETDELLINYAFFTAYTGDLRYDVRRERIPQLEAQTAAAQRLGKRQDEGNALGNLGIAYDALGEYQRAIDYHEQHLTVAREIGDRRGEGTALGNLGIAYDALGEYQHAIDYHEQHLAIAREIGDRRGEGTALGNLGGAYLALGEYQRAIDYYEQAFENDQEIGNQEGVARHSWNLGLLYEKQGDLARAVPLMQVWVDFLQQIGHAGVESRIQRLEEVKRKLAEQGG